MEQIIGKSWEDSKIVGFFYWKIVAHYPEQIWDIDEIDEVEVLKQWHMGVSENSVPLNPMVNDHYPY